MEIIDTWENAELYKCGIGNISSNMLLSDTTLAGLNELSTTYLKSNNFTKYNIKH